MNSVSQVTSTDLQSADYTKYDSSKGSLFRIGTELQFYLLMVNMHVSKGKVEEKAFIEKK